MSYVDKQALICRYGSVVLRSDVFHMADEQAHHFVSTVALHSLNVAFVCIFLSRIFKRLDIRYLIIAALVHDLGILGRKTKYVRGRDCIFGHPIDSLHTLEQLMPDADEKMSNIIETHMFPLSKHLPHGFDAVMFGIADKIAAIGDVFVYRKMRISFDKLQKMVV